jgi:cadmium resistance protein CadD (predicted permease)
MGQDGVIAVAGLTFLTTNIAGLAVLCGLYAVTRTEPQSRAVFFGSVGAFAAVLLLCAIAVEGVNVPAAPVRWLGLVPIAFGMFTLLRQFGRPLPAPALWPSEVFFQIAFWLMLTAGGGNLRAYVRLFDQAGLSIAAFIAIAYAIVFALLSALAQSVFANEAARAYPRRVTQPVVSVVTVVAGCLLLLQ